MFDGFVESIEKAYLLFEIPFQPITDQLAISYDVEPHGDFIKGCKLCLFDWLRWCLLLRYLWFLGYTR